jgi:Flp pilus assembly CpaE family ATPase
VLGLLDESAGLAAAVRLAAAGPPGPAGRLDVPALARLAPLVSPELRVLTGIPRADRWPELRPASLEVVWATARQLADLVVVDCGFNLERDEELTFDTPAPRRNGATLVTLEHADVVVAVARADPVGLARFARALPALREAAPAATLQVVVTQVRRSVLGSDPYGQVLAALERYAGVHEAVLLPDDRPALDRALARGQTLAEAAPSSPLRRELAGLAAGIADGLGPLGAAAPGKAPRASRWRSPRRTARGGAPGRGTGVPEPQSLV